MKLTKEQLKNLIKEEASRIRKEMQLEKDKTTKKEQLEQRKEEIISEMNEMYGEDVQEIFGLGKTPQQKAVEKAQADAALRNAILMHPVAKKMIALGTSKGLTPESATEQVVAIFKTGTTLRGNQGQVTGFKNVPPIVWDDTQKKLVAGKASFSAPGMSLAEAPKK